jgi:hypothetical protein
MNASANRDEMPLPAEAGLLSDRMKRAGLKLVWFGDVYGVVPQSGGATIYMEKLASVAQWFERRERKDPT